MNHAPEAQAAERKYKAFISYRHRPLDSEIAGKLHKRIERYVIPENLRREGADGRKEKKLGLVFRDLEELPIADDLDENIRIALDHSEFLIVICSPQTPGSEWVRREISYFLEHHSRDHLLSVLVDGEPGESFPDELTQVKDESGNVIGTVEPLAANIVADSARKRNRLFGTESLRIIAALLGCPYDLLYRREQRYKMQRLIISFAAAAAVAAIFIGMLLDRNAKIREQLLLAKINESGMHAELSGIALRNGDYRGALENALDALPGRDPQRPYVASAEKALASALYLYGHGGIMRYDQSIDRDTAIQTIAFSPDGSKLAVSDAYGKICLYDANTGELLWEAQHTTGAGELIFVGESLLLVKCSGYSQTCLSVADGSAVWTKDDALIAAVSAEQGLCLCFSAAAGKEYPLWIMDAKTGETSTDLGKLDEKYDMIRASAISDDGRYAGVLLSCRDEKRAHLWIYDLQSKERVPIDQDLCFYHLYTDYTLQFCRDGNLVLAACGNQDSLKQMEGWDKPFIKLYDAHKKWADRYTTPLDFGTTLRRANGLVDDSDYMDYMECGENGIALASKTRIIMVEKESGEIRWNRDLPDYVVEGHLLPNDSLCLVLADGIITFCSDTNGTLSYDLSRAYFDCHYSAAAASCVGDSYFDSRYAVVSSENRKQAAVVSFGPDGGDEALAGSEQIPFKARFYYSPSYKWIASVYYDYDRDVCCIGRIDPAGEAETMTAEVKGYASNLSDQTRVFVTDSGKLILGGKIWDFDAGTAKSLTPQAGDPELSALTDASCKCLRDGRVFTASVDKEEDGKYALLLWEDAEAAGRSLLPMQYEGDRSTGFYRYGCLAAGACGAAAVYVQEYEGPREYAIYLTEEDRWTQAPFLDPNAEEVTAMADARKWMAVQRTDGRLSLFDLTDGSEILTMESDLSGQNVAKMMFARDDDWLVVLTKTGDLVIFSTKDGKELHRSYYGNSLPGFRADGRYDVQLLPEEGRILLVFDGITYTDPVCISIDAESMEINGFYAGFSGYLPPLKKVVLSGSDLTDTPASFCPLYSLENMQEMAEEILGENR